MKSKQRDKVEYYKGVIRQLKAENARLRKELKRFDHQYDQEDEDEYTEVEPRKNKNSKQCPNCEDGEINSVEVVGRMITKCNECDYRKVEKV